MSVYLGGAAKGDRLGAVGRREFVSLGAARIRELCKPRARIYDARGIFSRQHTHGRL